MQRKHAMKLIGFYPPFEYQKDLADQYFRMLWYLNPIKDQISKIVIPYSASIQKSGHIPEYLDESILDLESDFLTKITFQPITTKNQEAFLNSNSFTDILLWNSKQQILDKQTLTPAPRLWNVDNKLDRNEGSNYIKISENLLGERSDIHLSRDKFNTMVKVISSEFGFVLGTGPNVRDVLRQDFVVRGKNTIICNSAVKNIPLLEKFKPKIIVASDPIFHAGCSSYAGEFRRHLISALDKYESYFIVPMRDYVIYSRNLPERFRERIIGIPVNKNNNLPNLNLIKGFSVTYTENVLTLLLFPLACTLFEKIHIAGFDGKPRSSDEYFWKHDPASQINHQMDKIKEAHPSFFNISYNDYYEVHLQTVKKWVEMALLAGKVLINQTESHIPALQSITALQ